MARPLRVLDEQRRPAARLDQPVDDLRDLEVRIDLGGDRVSSPSRSSSAIQSRRSRSATRAQYGRERVLDRLLERIAFPVNASDTAPAELADESLHDRLWKPCSDWHIPAYPMSNLVTRTHESRATRHPATAVRSSSATT